MPSQDTVAAERYAHLLTFSWWTTAARYCDWTEDITVDSVTWTSEMRLKFNPLEWHGGVRQTVLTLRMPPLAPLDDLVSVYPHAPVAVTLEEIIPGDSASRRTLFSGDLAKTVRNSSGMPGLVEVSAESRKARLNFPLGIIADSYCDHALGDQNCCVDLDPHRQTRTVGAIDGNTITLTGLTTPADDARFWIFGDVSFEGLTLTIIERVTTTSFKLIEPPPLSWVGQSVVVTPGCDQKLGTCQRRWNNEQRILPLGIKMPDYHPILEDPG